VMFGKVMSIPDSLIARYFEICTTVPLERVRQLLAGNPRDAKAELARTIVADYHGEAAAAQAAEEFTRVFSRRELPSEMPEVILPAASASAVDLLIHAGLASSRSEARRLVLQGGVSLNGRRLEDPVVPQTVEDGSVLQVGPRRFARLRVLG
jgi:tyrosyl-tRNA synthetase